MITSLTFMVEMTNQLGKEKLRASKFLNFQNRQALPSLTRHGAFWDSIIGGI